MESSLMSLSNELAEIVQRFSSQVVAVHARRHFPSSGVRLRSGVVVTADHTIQRDEDIQVTLPDGKTSSAELIGRDPGTDLAVLRVEGLTSSAEVPAATDTARTGELALVLGRSPDSGVNASLGIVSAVSGPWRTWRGGQLEQYVRLDAKLFPNSSGGAVVNAQGKMIGIATSALSRIAGLAIPMSAVGRVAEKLLEKGFIPRGYLGIGVQSVSIPDDLRAKTPFGNQSAVIILSVEPGGPANKAGLLIGDMIVGLDEIQIENTDDLQSFSDSGAIGKSVKVSFVRAGTIKELPLVVGERPEKRG